MYWNKFDDALDDVTTNQIERVSLIPVDNNTVVKELLKFIKILHSFVRIRSIRFSTASGNGIHKQALYLGRF
jgi:hypothetical protein